MARALPTAEQKKGPHSSDPKLLTPELSTWALRPRPRYLVCKTV